MSTTAVQLNLTPTDKIRFVATVLPVLGALGGMLKATGSSDEAVLVVTVPLLFIAFFGWRLAIAFKQVHQVREDSETKFWQSRDARSTQRFHELIEAQQEELSELRRRQRAEQERLLRENASSEQLAGMMERHRGEYEAILSRRTA